ncbi:MAG: putative assembly protein [Candidatus Accumulibacter adjunctus]|uniref:Assembly protein n=1 Tax=Candidatus Accumulibacter adjunctus TaxID=1454001 RepID=A0A011NYM9_9PROT|nr:MAG: putative assembly protein [Candidatus Accumulibacter adjunctus]
MSRWRWFLVALTGLVGLPFAAALFAIVALLVSGATIDASRWRDWSAERMSSALGRPVFLAGPFELSLGRAPEVRIGELRILNPPGFTAREFLALADGRVRIDLLDALFGELHLRSLEASTVRLWLERASNGRSNWDLRRPDAPASPPGRIEVGQIVLHGLAVDYRDERSATHHGLDLDELRASGGSNEMLRLTMRGRIGKQLPFALKAEGGPLRLIREEAEPWPFILDIESPGARLQASGAVDAGKGEARIAFGPDAAALAPAAAGDESRAVARTNELAGQLELVFGDARPRLSGALSVAALDLRPFDASDEDAPDDAPDAVTQQGQMLLLRDLVPVDISVDLHIGEWRGLPVDVEDAKFDLHADASGVRMPISATLAGIPFSGRVDLDTAAATPTLALRFAARDVVLDDLVRQLTGAADGAGRLGQIELRLGGRGETTGALLSDLELSLAASDARLSAGKRDDGRPLASTLATLEVALPRGQRLRGYGRGTLLAEPLQLSLRGDTLPEMLRELAMPVELEIAAAPARLRIEGMLAHPAAKREAALDFALQVRRTGDLARWLGVAPESRLPLALRGRMRIASDAWFLEQTTLGLGRSELTVDARITRGDDPSVVAAVRSRLIDVPELATLRGGSARSNDAPLFPDALDLPDIDLDLALQRVILGRSDLQGVRFAGRVRAGGLLPSTFSGRVAGAPFSGLVALDQRGRWPEVRLDLATGEVDLGLLLRDLGAAENIAGRAEKLQLSLRGRGNTQRELASLSAFEARVVGGHISVLGAQQRPLAEFHLGEAAIAVRPGEPIRLRLDGTFDETALALTFSTGTLADLLRDAAHLPFALAAETAGAKLTLDGEVALPLGRAGQLTLEMSGERFDMLSGLARVELPAWGPWSLRGPLHMTASGYEVPRLQLRVGDSRLEGSGTLDMSRPRPRLDLRLSAPSIQLDDFPLPERLADPSPPVGAAESLRRSAGQLVVRSERLLGAGFLRRFDSYIAVEVQEVLAGDDRLADGSLRVQVVDGRVFIGPAELNIPGGTLRLAAEYDPSPSEVALAVGAYVERFDYGIIARRFRRADDVRGLLSLHLALAGRAPSLATIMHHADGEVDFAVWPTELQSGVFSLWSVNLLLTVVPLIDPGGDAVVNCVVGRFDLKDGKLSDDKIIIDTTRVRIRGAGSANLAREQLAFVFRPRGKGFAVFRLQTPLRVSGTLTDFRFGIEPRDLLESVLRLIASPILLPIEWFTLGPLPRDGADVCTNPLRERAAGS